MTPPPPHSHPIQDEARSSALVDKQDGMQSHRTVSVMDYAASFHFADSVARETTRVEIQMTGNICLAVLAGSRDTTGTMADIFMDMIGRLDLQKAGSGEIEAAFHRASIAMATRKNPGAGNPADNTASGLAVLLRDGRIQACGIGQMEAYVILPGGLFETLTLQRSRSDRLGQNPIRPKTLGPLPFHPGSRILGLTGNALDPQQLSAHIKTALDDRLEISLSRIATSVERRLPPPSRHAAGFLIGNPSSIR